MAMRVFLGLGSNVGARDLNLHSAIKWLSSLLNSMEASLFVDTIALDRMGNPDRESPSYLNTVVSGFCDLEPRELFEKIMLVERNMGRPPAEKSRYLPRIIDIDILYIANDDGLIRIDDEDLVVPHPRLEQRPFFLEPLKKWGVMPPHFWKPEDQQSPMKA